VEKAMPPQAVQLAVQITGLPVSMDTANAEALQEALKACPDKPLVNSVNGEQKSLEMVLPLAKERGAAVIDLTMDEQGIPKAPEQRLRIAQKILAHAVKEGISQEEVIIDPLALTVGADQQAALTTLETIRLIAKELRMNTMPGASNIPCRLPRGPSVNNIFLALAIAAGITCSVVDPGKARRAILITDLLLWRDEFALRYVAYRPQRDQIRS
jgi:5-methyltetrahydrofolate--homocysteine methyltransferase